jgi:two-component system LytT family sensor kinase
MRNPGAVLNDVNATMDGSETDQRHPGADELQHLGATAVGLQQLGNLGTERSERRYRWITVAIIILFWAVQYALYTVEAYVRIGAQMGGSLGARAIISSWGLILSFGIVQVLDSLRQRSLGVRAAAAICLAVLSAAVQAVIVEQVVMLMFPPDPKPSPYWLEYASNFFPRLWVFACFGGVSVALSSVVDIREREERISALQALAHSAQLRALRNQLSPHFLFNALNSIAALISSRNVGEAETMTENLADFLRLALALDPQQLITLDEEIRLQQLYLNIEQVRFPDRLRLRIDVPEEARQALVPSLVTQPLIENSIKYGVARSTEPVELTISAAADDDNLELVISNSGGNARLDEPKGAHFGLKNVAERIRMHFGAGGHFAAEPQPNGGFRNVIRIPLQVAR